MLVFETGCLRAIKPEDGTLFTVNPGGPLVTIFLLELMCIKAGHIQILRQRRCIGSACKKSQASALD